MFNWLKKLFSKPEPVASMPIEIEPKLLEKPCRTCGKPIFYDPSWEHIPNYLCICSGRSPYDGVLEVLVKGEEYLGGEEP